MKDFDPERVAIQTRSVVQYIGTGTVVSPADDPPIDTEHDDCRLIVAAAQYDTAPHFVFRIGIESCGAANFQLAHEDLNELWKRVRQPAAADRLQAPGKYHYVSSGMPLEIEQSLGTIHVGINPVTTGERTGLELTIPSGQGLGGTVLLTPDQHEHFAKTLDQLSRRTVDYDHIPITDTLIDVDKTDINPYDTTIEEAD